MYLKVILISLAMLHCSQDAKDPQEVVSGDEEQIGQNQNNNLGNFADQENFNNQSDQEINEFNENVDNFPIQTNALDEKNLQDQLINEPLPEMMQVSDDLPQASIEATKHQTAKMTLWWIGFHHQKDLGKSRVELITVGDPKFDFLQETNKNGQPELVIRYYNTQLRHKLRRPLDTRSFSSNIVFIRTRENKLEGVVDILLTMRAVAPIKYFAENGNILLSTPISDQSYGNTTITSTTTENAIVERFKPTMLKGSLPPTTIGMYKTIDKVFNNPVELEKQNNTVENQFINNNLNQQFDNSNFNNEYEEANQSNNTMDSSNSEFENQNNSNINQQENFNQNEDQSNEQNEDFDQQNIQEEQQQTLIGPKNIKQLFEVNHAMVAQDSPTQENEENIFDAQEDEEYETEDLQGSQSQLQSQSENSSEGQGVQQTQEDPGSNDSLFIQEDAGDQFQYETDSSEEQQMIEESASSDEELSNLYAEEETPEEVEGFESADEPSESKFPPIDMDFKGASLGDVIMALSNENKTNFIYPEEITNKTVTMNLRNVPWDEALQAVLASHSLGMNKLDGNIIRIDSLQNLDREKEKLNDVRMKSNLLIPTKVLVVRLSYAKADEAAKIIEQLLPSREYDKRVQVKADIRTNSVIVEAIPEELQKIRALIERVDLQTPQVKISTRVVEVLKSVQKFLGINWGGFNAANAGKGLGFGSLPFPNSMTSVFSVDSGAESATQAGQLDINFGSINNSFELDLRLRMAELSNYTRSIQNSNVIVLDNEKAVMRAGQIDYFEITNGNGDSSLSEVRYELLIEVTPHITADGAIQMMISITNDSPKEITTGSATSKNTRELKTSMLRQNGETAVIGGLYTTLIRKTVQGFPILKDIPIIGALFRSSGKAEDKRELMVLVTPTVVNSERSLASSIEGAETQTLVNQEPQQGGLALNQEPIEGEASPTQEDLSVAEDEDENRGDGEANNEADSNFDQDQEDNFSNNQFENENQEQ